MAKKASSKKTAKPASSKAKKAAGKKAKTKTKPKAKAKSGAKAKPKAKAKDKVKGKAKGKGKGKAVSKKFKPAPAPAPPAIELEGIGLEGVGLEGLGVAVPTRDFVFDCIRAAAPGRPFNDDSVLSQIPVQRPDDLGVCLNARIPLTGRQRWVSGQIDRAWTVSILTARTDFRRNSPP